MVRKTLNFTVTECIQNSRITRISTSRGFLTVTDLNDFNGPAQTTNLGVRSSNLFGRAISVYAIDATYRRFPGPSRHAAIAAPGWRHATTGAG